jgi:hypothetical protein
MGPKECDEDDYSAVCLGFAMANPVVGIRRDMAAVRIHRLEVFDDCVEIRPHWEVDFASMPRGASSLLAQSQAILELNRAPGLGHLPIPQIGLPRLGGPPILATIRRPNLRF